MKKNRFIGNLTGGVLLMTISNLIVKAAGLFFKIPLTSLIGEEGMGYFNGAYTLFTWLYMVSCSGLPTAASMLISRIPESRKRSGALRIFRISLTVFTLIGLGGCLLLIFGAPFLSKLMRTESSEAAIIAVAPTLLFVCQSAALRGYFQGFGDLRWHSLSQVIEALGKLALGVALAYHAIACGESIAIAAAYAAGGITVGVACGTVTLYLAFVFRKKSTQDPCLTSTGSILRSLISAMLPITLSSSIMSLTNLIDSMLMTRTLHAYGMAQSEVAAIWGNYSSLAVPMFNLPPVLTMPIAYALLPALSSALSLGDTEKSKKLTADAAKSTAILAIPCAVGLAAMSGPILSLLFADDVAERGAMMLTLLAPSSMLLCMLGLTNTILQASGHERVPLFAMMIGAAAKLTATWFLTPTLGKYATPVSTFICYFTVLVISVAAIAYFTPLGKAITRHIYLKPLICSVLAITLCAVIHPIVGTLPAIGSAAAAYFALAFISGQISIINKTEP